MIIPNPRMPKGGGATRAAGFTVAEFTVAMGLAVLITGMFAVFSEGTGRSMASLTMQSSLNQVAGNGTEFIISRIRLANTGQVDTAGNTLTLGFDDNPDVDSDGDKIAWNDRDHYAQFQFVDLDGFSTTLDNNEMIYRTNTSNTASTVLVPASLRRLSSLPFFQITNSTVLINFGLLSTNDRAMSQAIEIRTKALMRNRTR